jgi:hypothetical protein
VRSGVRLRHVQAFPLPTRPASAKRKLGDGKIGDVANLVNFQQLHQTLPSLGRGPASLCGLVDGLG